MTLRGRSVSVQIIVCLSMLMGLLPALAQTLEGDCARQVAQIDRSALAPAAASCTVGDGDAVEQAQILLLSVGYDPVEIDGIIGPNTRRALTQYCEAYTRVRQQVARRCTLAPTWLETLTACEFRQWTTDLGKKQGCNYGTDLLLDYVGDRNPSCVAAASGGRPAGRVGVYYELTEQDTDVLAARGDLVGALASLSQERYDQPTQVMAAVRDSLGLTPAAASGLPRGVRNCVAARPVFRLSQGGVNGLRVGSTLSEATLEAVGSLVDLDFPSRVTLRDRAQSQIEDAMSAGKVETLSKEQVAQASRAANQVASAAARQYWLNRQASGFLSRSAVLAPVPDEVLGAVGDVVGVPYADRGLFDSALRNVVFTGAGDAGGSGASAEMRLSVAAHAAALLREAPALAPLLEERATAFEDDLRGLLGPGDMPMAPAVAEAVSAVALQARKQPVYDTTEVRWDGEGCGCSADYEQDVVYGFYLPWEGLRGTPTAPSGLPALLGAQASEAVDLNVHSRVGYYAMPLSDDGEALFDVLPGEGVMRAVRRNDSRLDLVVYKESAEWSSVTNLDAFFSRVRIRLTQGGKDAALARPGFGGADGVTLFLDGYPTDDEASDALVKFLKELHTAMAAMPQPSRWNLLRKDLFKRRDAPSLNVMLRGRDVGEGIFTTRYLSELIALQGDQEPLVDLFLVFLEAPTTDTKKDLRLWVERTLRGDQRRSLLRRIVPVVPPAGHQREARGEYVQFDDDLIYFQDNFRGVGFWPMISPDSAQAEQTRQRVLNEFSDRSKQDVLKRMVMNVVPELCTVACPNRSSLRGVLLGGVLAFILLWVASAASFSVQAVLMRYRRTLLGVVLALFAVFAASSVCDPMFKRLSDDITLLLLFAGLVLVSVRMTIRADEQDMP